MLNIPSTEADGTVNSNAVAVHATVHKEKVDLETLIGEWDKSNELQHDTIETVMRSDAKCVKSWNAKWGGHQYTGRYIYMMKGKTGCVVMFSSTPHSIRSTAKEFDQFLESIRLD